MATQAPVANMADAGPGGLRAALGQAHPALFSLYGGLVAFAAYSSMYAFRKPFAAASYDDVAGWTGGVDFKVALVIAQMAGYALSKFIGVKVVSEMASGRRGIAILALVAIAWAALILFAILPPAWKIAAMFLNGLPLGMIWGLVFGYLEGRRTTEVLAAILCGSFILASGVVKSVGTWLMQAWHVGEFWMPAATGALFYPLLVISVAGLAQLPPPTPRDQDERMARPPMDLLARQAFLRRYGPGVTALVTSYVLLTAVRDFRDNFAAELWRELGYDGVSSVFTASELPVAAITLSILASLVLIRNNRRALLVIHAIIMAGAVLFGLATLAFQLGLIGPLGWMIAGGLGLYLAYAPFSALLFERLVAATRTAGTAGFLIYVADAAGYVGSIGVMLVRNGMNHGIAWIPFYSALSYSCSAVCLAAASCSLVYFRRRTT